MKHLKYINELKISQLNSRTIEMMKENLIYKLEEYKNALMINIKDEDGKIKYENFDRLNTRIIERELNNFLDKDFIEEVKVVRFIKTINMILDSKNKTVKKEVVKLFKEYYKFIDNMIKQKSK